MVVAKYAETTILMVLPANNVFLSRPRKLGNLFVNTTALTEKHFGVVFCIVVLGFLLCPFFALFLRGMKKPKLQNKAAKKKQDHKMHNKKTPSLVTQKTTDNTDIKQFNFIVSIGNKQHKTRNQELKHKA